MEIKVSFVVVARNDNYGGNFLQRMQLFTDTLSTLCIKYKLPTELIVVEWNPPQDKERLQNAITWKIDNDYFQVKIIEVPNEIHKQFLHSERVPLYEFIGKNVGIRRAKGAYILATNPDIIFTDSLIEWLSQSIWGIVTAGCYYRATRYDVESPLPIFKSMYDLFNYCSSHVVQVNNYSGSSKRNTKQQCFYLLDKIIWRVKHPTHDRPFTNAAGDFLLMHRRHWINLRGYPELIGSDSYGRLHIDGMILFAAMYNGLREVRLHDNLRIYHQEHPRKFDIIPYSRELENTYTSLTHGSRSIKLNDDGWGLISANLPEVMIRQRGGAMNKTDNGNPDNEGESNDACIICRATSDLQLHTSFGKSGGLLCADCRGVADRNIP